MRRKLMIAKHRLEGYLNHTLNMVQKLNNINGMESSDFKITPRLEVFIEELSADAGRKIPRIQVFTLPQPKLTPEQIEQFRNIISEQKQSLITESKMLAECMEAMDKNFDELADFFNSINGKTQLTEAEQAIEQEIKQRYLGLSLDVLNNNSMGDKSEHNTTNG